MRKGSIVLFWKSLAGLTSLIVIVGLCIFVPAWSLAFWHGWVYLSIFAVSTALITLYLWNNDPKLLERRAKAGALAEKENSQKIIGIVLGLAFISIIIVPALDHRFGWSDVPILAVIAGDVVVALGFFLIFLAFRANTFAGITIEIAAGHQPIATGPYALVRHPMYSGGIIMLFGTPMALGSWWGLLALIPVTLAIMWRLIDEEKFLSRNLKGYTEYCQKTRFRLIPFVW